MIRRRAPHAPYVLPRDFTRYAGWSVEQIAEAGDVQYVAWLASDAIADPELRKQAAEQLSRAREAPVASPPALVIVLPLEEPGVVALRAETRRDEARLRSWLRRSRSFAVLPELLERLLDDLDEADTRRAA